MNDQLKLFLTSSFYTFILCVLIVVYQAKTSKKLAELARPNILLITDNFRKEVNRTPQMRKHGLEIVFNRDFADPNKVTMDVTKAVVTEVDTTGVK